MLVNWETYYEAAKKCHDLAVELRSADKPVHDAVKGECAGMAGDAPGCKQWGETYDRVAQETMQTCTHLADALTNFGNVLYASGYNYGVANKSSPAPPRPTIQQVGEYRVSIPTSVHENGNGVKHNGGAEEFFSELVAKLVSTFEKLPNGDVDKLAKASTTWKTFAENETVKGASAKISTISSLFDGMDQAHNRQLIQETFGSLKSGADNLAAASLNVAAPVADYHGSTREVGEAIKSAMETFAWAVGLLVAGAALGALFSFGGSIAVAGAGVTAAAADTINVIRGLYSSKRLFQILKVTLAASVTVGVIDSFDKVPTLSDGIKALATIIAMRAVIDDGDQGSGTGPDSAAVPNKDVTDEMARMLREGIHPGEDCSEIAERLEKVAAGAGEILRVDPPPGKDVTVEEYGRREEFLYHEVYTDGKYVYDPRHNSNPVPIEEWRKTIMGDNPGATIKPVG
ncbi:hypothetical protein [Nocardia sp. XZ_19_369]|uniref:hypothetical protein n=1 Tax=Nocardia sp. XZ_19_369 TaxID=2769487 RepID=UPI00188EF338|nr:hypothetical protein [Nocardia sp. XZ_19_369]